MFLFDYRRIRSVSGFVKCSLRTEVEISRLKIS